MPDIPKISAKNQKLTLQEQVYSALKLCLLNGDFVPGNSVTIRGLAAKLDVSAMPVREALRRLTAERALSLSSTGRVRIPTMTREKLDELVSARVCLEKHAACSALPEVTKSEINRMVKLNASIDRCIAKQDHRRYLIQHREFHFYLYRIGAGQVFLPLIESVWLQVSPFLRFTLSQEHLRNYNTNDRHVEVIDALQKKDSTALGFAIEADIRHGIGSLIESDWNAIQIQVNSIG